MSQPSLFADEPPPVSRYNHRCERCNTWPTEVKPGTSRPTNIDAYVRALVNQIRRDVETIDQKLDEELNCFYTWRVRLLRSEVQRVRSLDLAAYDEVQDAILAVHDDLAAAKTDRSDEPGGRNED